MTYIVSILLGNSRVTYTDSNSIGKQQGDIAQSLFYCETAGWNHRQYSIGKQQDDIHSQYSIGKQQGDTQSIIYWKTAG